MAVAALSTSLQPASANEPPLLGELGPGLLAPSNDDPDLVIPTDPLFNAAGSTGFDLAAPAIAQNGVSVTVVKGSPPAGVVDVVTAAASAWMNQVDFNGTTLDIALEWIPISGAVVAFGGPAWTAKTDGSLNGREGAYYLPGALYEAQRGEDVAEFDVRIQMDSSISWHLGSPETSSTNAASAYSVALHEIGHGLGFVSTLKRDGTISIPNPMVFTPFVETSGGQRVLGSGGISASDQAVFRGGSGTPIFLDYSLLHSSESHYTWPNDLMTSEVARGASLRISSPDLTVMTTIGWMLRPASPQYSESAVTIVGEGCRRGDVPDAFGSMTSNEAFVYRLYCGFFDRYPDIAGYRYWTRRASSGAGMDRIASEFAVSSEFSLTYGNVGNEEWVRHLYEDVLGRSIDVAGYNYWVRQLNTGASNRGSVSTIFIDSVEFRGITNTR